MAFYLSRFLRLSLFVALILAGFSPFARLVCHLLNWHSVPAQAADSGIVNGSSGISPMACITVQTGTAGAVKVSTRWAGDNLAVHSTIIAERCDGIRCAQATKNDAPIWRWTVTHRPTGFIAARFNDLRSATLIARQFDEFFHHQTKESIHSDKELVEEWKDVVAKYKGKIG